MVVCIHNNDRNCNICYKNQLETLGIPDIDYKPEKQRQFRDREYRFSDILYYFEDIILWTQNFLS